MMRPSPTYLGTVGIVLAVHRLGEKCQDSCLSMAESHGEPSLASRFSYRSLKYAWIVDYHR